MNLNDMKFDQLVPAKSKYLSKEDVGEDGIILTISHFKYETIETRDKGVEEKVVMYFEEDVKPMILNRVNSQLIGQATGCRTVGESKGKKIVVYADPSISFGDKIIGGIRIKKIAGPPKAAPKKAAEAAEELNDEVPF